MRFEGDDSIKRLGIYFFYDRDGIIDKYVFRMLEELKNNCSDICFVINGEVSAESYNCLIDVVQKENVLIRENKGFDVWAYKTAMEHYGWERLAQYDEIVLMNFTLFGPLYPFSEMFKEMDSRDVDFWGITKHHGIDRDPFGTSDDGVIWPHIQSSFICIRKSLIKEVPFQEYWNNMPMIYTYYEAIGKHEAKFTHLFEQLGYKSDVYINTDDLIEFTDYPLMLEPKTLVKEKRCPVIKRKAFSNMYKELLNTSGGEATVELYKYIENNLDYDLNLVWENILRVDNMADIKERMHLNYILPKEFEYVTERESNLKIGLVMHIYFPDEVRSCREYAESMPENTDFIITTTSEETLKIINEEFSILPNKKDVKLIPNRGRDVSSLLVAAAPYIMDYDLVCAVHDKKTTQFKPYTVGESFAYKCFENTLGSKAYAKNIITTFTNEPRLGMLMPPPPNHADFFGMLGFEWTGNYENTINLAQELGVRVSIDEQKEPMAPLGTMFWFRPKALKKLFDKKWQYDDFPEEPNGIDCTFLHAIERIYGYVAQDAGYYIGWCMTDKYAAIEHTNLHYMMRNTAITADRLLGPRGNFDAFNRELGKLRMSKRAVIYHMKNALRGAMPKCVWSFFQNGYRKAGGKKWLDESFYK